MIKKLRSKFIFTAMLSMSAVLLIIISSINIINYNKVVSDADRITSLLAENGGMFPKPEPKGNGEIHPFSPETPYETRFFTVLFSSSGKRTATNTGKIAAIDSETAAEYAEQVFASSKSIGFYKNYRYMKKVTDSDTLIIFLDCTRGLQSFYNFFVISACVSFIGLISVFLLIFFTSKKIIRPVAESYEKQKRFITDAGHELKTPLTVISADAEILAMELDENEWLQDIQYQTKKLAELTKELIYLSKMDENREQLQMIDFPVSDITAEEAAHFQSRAKTLNKTVSLNIKPMLSLHGDEKAVRHLISILMDNALKYSNDNGRISVTLKKYGGKIILEVSNSVDNVNSETMKHLFERFYRGDSSRSSETGGYGLGLSIAKAIVMSHKGQISADSDGQCVTVTAVFPA